MTAKDTEGRYGYALEAERLIGDIVSPTVAREMMRSLFLSDEQPSDLNMQQRLREAIGSGCLSVKGLGPSGVKRLQSALALGRALYIDTPAAGTVIDDPSVAAAAFAPIAWEPVEQFAAIALDVKHRILSMRAISTGTATETCAHPRDIFRWVMQVGGTRCVVGHNQPSIRQRGAEWGRSHADAAADCRRQAVGYSPTRPCDRLRPRILFCSPDKRFVGGVRVRLMR